MTPPRPRQTFYVIQYLRAVAAALVVFYHAGHEVISNSSVPAVLRTVPEIRGIGACGVDIFFVISGFIIFTTMPVVSGAGPAATFMRDRILRVMPLYWFWTTVLVLAMFAGVALTNTPLDAAVLLSSYTLFPYELRPDYYHPILDPGWTLSFEMAFYMAAAVTIACLPHRHRLPGLFVILLVVQAATWAIPVSVGVRRWLGSPLIYEFIAGAGIAVLFRRHHARVGAHPHLGWGLIGVGSACFAASMVLADPIAWRVLVWGIPSIAMVVGAILANRPPGSAVTRLLFWLGAASYSLYVSHYLATAGLGGAVKRGFLRSVDPDALSLGATVAIIVFGSLSYVVVERPLLALFKGRRRPSSAIGGEVAVS